NEVTVTQVDWAAASRSAVILIECKFTETGGPCSQPNGRTPQCNGRYAKQTNPHTNTEARCALSGKGIRYWDHIHHLYEGVRADVDRNDCPFRGPDYQWMRNSALARSIRLAGRSARVIAAYVDGDDHFLQTARKVRAGKSLGLPTTNADDRILPLSYQKI